MKKINKFLLIMLSALMVFALASCGSTASDLQSVEAIKKAGKLVVYTNAEFPPFEYLAGGVPAGVDVDICQAIADELGVELDVQNVKFDTIISSVEGGKASLGAAGITVTDERKESVDFSVSYTTSKQYIILPADSTVAKIEDLAGVAIGVQLGTTGDFIVTDEVNGSVDDDGNAVQGVLQGTGASVTTYSNANLAAEALKAGKIGAVVVDMLPAQLIAQNSGDALKAIELVYADGSNTEETYAIAIAKDNTTLLETVNTVLNRLISEGKIDEFIIKHSTEALADATE